MPQQYRGVKIHEGDSFQVMAQDGKVMTVTRYRAIVRGEVVRGYLEEVKEKIDVWLRPAA